MDVWEYIQKEKLEVPSIYFSHERECFRRADQWLPVPPPYDFEDKADPYEDIIRLEKLDPYEALIKSKSRRKASHNSIEK